MLMKMKNLSKGTRTMKKKEKMRMTMMNLTRAMRTMMKKMGKMHECTLNY